MPREFELPGKDAIMRKEGRRLIIEPAPPKSLLAVLDSLARINDKFPRIPELPAIRLNDSAPCLASWSLSRNRKFTANSLLFTVVFSRFTVFGQKSTISRSEKKNSLFFSLLLKKRVGSVQRSGWY